MKCDGPNALALRQLDADGAQELDQVVELLGARGVVGAVKQRGMRGFKQFGGGDIGEDHELFDQPMRLEPLRPAHVLQPSFGVENKLALGQIEIERIALLTLDFDDRMRGVERLEYGLDKRLCRLVRSTVDRRLGLLVGELGRGAHHDAVEFMRALAPVGADHHAQGERGAVLMRA